MVISPPKRFVGLHAHSTFSIGDAIGYPDEHLDFAFENGCDAMAITDHGNCSGYAHAFIHQKSMAAAGKQMKYIPGCEFYLHPDLKQWRIDKDHQQDVKKRGAVALFDSEENGLENEDASKTGGAFDPIKRRHHLVVLAKTTKGLDNLFTLVSKAHKDGFYKYPRIDYSLLKEHSEDLVVSTACVAGPLAAEVFACFPDVKWDDMKPTTDRFEMVQTAMQNCLDRLVDSMGRDNVFLELQFNRLGAQHLVNMHMLELAKRSGVRLVATADSHYCRPEWWQSREIYKKLSRMNYAEFDPTKLAQSVDDLKCQLYPKNAQQMWDEYKSSTAEYTFYDDETIRDAIEATHDIAHSVIGDTSPDTSMKLPRSIIKKEEEPNAVLRGLAIDGMKRLGLTGNDEYEQRLEYELGVIRDQGFALYFITMKSIIDIAKANMMVGCGRGSSAGSLVCYALNITELDPIRYGLLFERFMNPARKEVPDIDTDIADRDLLIKLLKEKFGDDNVLPVSNYNTFQLNTLIRDTSRFYGIPYQEVNTVMKQADTDVRKAVLKRGVDKNTFEMTYDLAMDHSDAFRNFIDEHPEISKHAHVLLKQAKTVSRHAGGLIVSERVLERMPVTRIRGELQCPFVEGLHFKHCGPLGWVKYDMLGLETLNIIQGTIERIIVNRARKNGVHELQCGDVVYGDDIIEHEGVNVSVTEAIQRGLHTIVLDASKFEPPFSHVRQYYDEKLHPSKLDLNDQDVYKFVYEDGNWGAIFQCTTHATQKFFMKGKPKSVIDIAALTSIYRPGPLAANADKLYINAKDNAESINYVHPLVESVLKETYNCIVFQEQTLKLGSVVGGLSMADCDKLRKALTKKSISGLEQRKVELQTLKDKFIAGAIKNGMEEKDVLKLFADISYHSGYSFNMSHGCSYAIDSYTCAFLSFHHTKEWFASYLQSVSGNSDKLETALRELQARSFKVTPIDINHATSRWDVLPDGRFMPSFSSVSGIGAVAIDEIMSKRPYGSVFDLLWDEDCKWKHSKANKKVFDALIKVGAFGSIDIVGDGKVFTDYSHMHRSIIGHWDELRRHGPSALDAALAEELGKEPWSKKEIVEAKHKLMGYFDIESLISERLVTKLAGLEIPSIDGFDAESGIFWFITTNAIPKLTRSGRPYLLLTAIGRSGKSKKIFLWNTKLDTAVPQFSVCVAQLDPSDFGASTLFSKLKMIG